MDKQELRAELEETVYAVIANNPNVRGSQVLMKIEVDLLMEAIDEYVDSVVATHYEPRTDF